MTQRTESVDPESASEPERMRACLADVRRIVLSTSDWDADTVEEIADVVTYWGFGEHGEKP